MMYLSRLLLNQRDPAVRRDLGDCQQLHRTLLRALPDGLTDDGGGARAAAGLLFRVEQAARTGRTAVLVQSALPPDWGRLPEGYLLAGGIAGPKPVADAYAELALGARLAFRLQANPTRKVDTTTKAERLAGTRRNGRRVALRRESELLDWLARKAEAAGFALERVTVTPPTGDPPANVRARADLDLTGRRDGARLTFGSVRFEGLLRVTDPDRLRQALVEGVGSGKAYGFGLLSVAPVRER